MRRTFHKVICTAPGVTVFKSGVESCRCRQNVVTEMPLGVWVANWRRHNDKLKVVSDMCETDSVYVDPATEPEPEPEPEVDVPVAIDIEFPRIPPLGQQPKRTYNKKAK